MDINKCFYVETTKDGITAIYNVGKSFFASKDTSNGNMGCFKTSDSKAINKYIKELSQDGWLPLSREDIDKTHINACGVVTAYPFKYRKGYISIEKIEAVAWEMNYEWKRADHDTNPFSALKDYSDFVDQLPEDAKYNTAMLGNSIKSFSDRLSNIGAIEQIENFFTEIIYIPDPRRFNRTIKELWKYYRSHIKDCCRLVWDDIYGDDDENFDIGALIDKHHEIKILQQYISDEAYEQRLNRSAAK